MKSNKFVEELKTKSDAELAQELVAAKKELFNLRFQNATNQLDNTARIKEGHSTLRGCQITRDDVHGRGFTCAVWTKKAVNLSLFHTEREMIYGNMVTIFFCKIAYFYHICLPDMV